MPPKPNALQAIRKQVAQDQRRRASAFAGSAFYTLQNQNAQRVGLQPPPPQGEFVASPSPSRARLKAGRITKKKPMAENRLLSTPLPPVVESWNPAGGERFVLDNESEPAAISSTLGIARIAGWRKDDFIESLQTLIKTIAEYLEITVEAIDYGGEERMDIFVRFRSELVAEAAMTKIQGVLLNGRKLQVKFA